MEAEVSQLNCNVKSPGSSNFSTILEGHKTGFHPRTPSSGSTSAASLNSFMSASAMTPPAKRFHLYSSQHAQQQQHQQQLHKVRNPFEAALAERLHLPTIASPSLFQRPTTPQLSSTQLEWTIDDVSSLRPVHVEPHETQFHDSPDPDYEAKAQSAISSFFKEHQIVPSPVNCPLRSQQRLLLAEINGNTPIAKPGRRIRDFGTQTALTFPAQLPPELEEALRPYFQPNLAVGYGEDGNPSDSNNDSNWLSFNNSGSGGGGVHNVSMRRKLFDIHNIILLDENHKVLQTPTPSTPKSTPNQQQQRPCAVIAGKLSDSFEKSSSMTSVSEYYSPNATTTSFVRLAKQNHIADIDSDCEGQCRQKRRSILFRSPNAAELSPILPSPKNANSRASKNRKKSIASQEKRNASSKDFETPAKFSDRSVLTRCRIATTIGDADDEDVNIEIDSSKFTPDRSSSPLHSFHSSASAGGGGGGGGGGSGSIVSSAEHHTTFATESFHKRISRLVVNSAGKSLKRDTPNYYLDTTEIMHECSSIATCIDDDDDDAMLVSQLSMQNSNLSNSSINSHCETPTGKRRSASRKNLSHSFTATNNWETSSEDDDSGENNNVDKENQQQVIANLQRRHKINKSLVNEIDKKILPMLLMNASQSQKRSDSNEIDKQQQQQQHVNDKESTQLKPTDGNSTNNNNEQLSQQNGNFYRTDSGFNEMTTSSSCSTSTGLLLLSQQDEQESSSRENFVLKLSGEFSSLGEQQQQQHQQQKMYSKLHEISVAMAMDVSMSTRCSTPTKQEQHDEQ